MSIEHCPRCSARVRVPIAAEPESWLRCPLCRAETQLSDLLAAEPPLLELIDGPSDNVPDYAPITAGEEHNEFHVMAGETLVTDEDSPTLPTGGLALGDNFFDEETDEEGASIGRAIVTKSDDDELFGFDDNPDSAALHTTSEDGKYVDIPADGEEEFNLSPDTSGELEMAATATPAFGAGLKGIPTGVPRRKKKSGILPMVLGVIGGGLFGIIIAYYGILMWAMGMDPIKLAKYFPESMQMLLPESLQDKSLASKSNSPPAIPEDNGNEPMLPNEDGEMPNNESSPVTPDGEGDTGAVSGLPGLSGSNPDTAPTTEPPTTDPVVDPTVDPLAMPEKAPPPMPSTDLLDPFGNSDPIKPFDPSVTPEAPVKPATDLLDPFGNTAPIKPKLPMPEITAPATGDPLNPLTPVPAPPTVNPLDPLATPEKPELPIQQDVATPSTDPFNLQTPKPGNPLDPPASVPADPLAPVAMPKASEPIMLTSASYAPADLEQSLTEVESSYQSLNDKPEDKATQISTYRALSHLGEVAGQLKMLGETPEKTQEHLTALQTMSKKLAADPALAGVAKWTSMWLTVAPEKRNNGIVLQGTPGTNEPVGKFHRTSLDVPGTEQKLTVVSEFPLLPNNDGKVTILGVIVDKPAEQIPGYPGPAERVIWASVSPMEHPAVSANELKAPEATDSLPAPAKSPLDDPFGENK